MRDRLGIVALCAFGLTVLACGSERPATQSADGSTSDGSMESSAATGDGASTGDDGAAGDDATTTSGDDGPVAAGDDATVDAPGDGAVPPSSDDGAAADATPGEGGASEAGIPGDAGSGVSCAPFGTACSYGSQCCSGVCDPRAGTCASSVTTCSPAAAPCTVGTDCCSGACVNGQCGTTQCLSIGASCPVAGNVCCTGNCSNGTCQSIAPSPACTTAGNACSSSTQCCSGLCSGGVCALGSSYCIQSGDICYHADDCCGGLCTAPNGQPVTSSNPGTCSQPASGSVNCTGVDGSLCPGGNCGNCCSRLCAPYGPTGVDICQPAQGCRVEGDLCRSNADCCGATGSGVLGDGSVICSNSMTQAAVGVCMTPGPTTEGGTCVPEGDVCHYTASNYTCGVSSARADCCGPQNPKYVACVLDPFGVPRCNALTGEGDAGLGCVAAGNACSMASECCNGNPCVPDASGLLTCSATSCRQAGQSCTANADCCAGLPCVAPPGSIQGTCTAVQPPPPPPPPADAGAGGDAGGAPDAGTIGDGGAPADSGYAADGGFTCALYGQSCSALPCCSGTQCIGGTCSTF